MSLKTNRRVLFLEILLYLLTALHTWAALLVFSMMSSIPKQVRIYLELHKQSEDTQKELIQKFPHAFNFAEGASLDGIVLSIGIKLLILACAWFILAKICRAIQSKTIEWQSIAKKLGIATILFAASFSLDVLHLLTTAIYNKTSGPDSHIPLDSLFNTMGTLSLAVPRMDGAVTLVLCLGLYAAKGLVLKYSQAQQELQFTI